MDAGVDVAMWGEEEGGDGDATLEVKTSTGVERADVDMGSGSGVGVGVGVDVGFVFANVAVKEGDILKARQQFLCHQCNSRSTSSRGLAKAVFDRFPHANTYQNTSYKRTPGSVSFHGCIPGKRGVVNMYAQDKPGGVTTLEDATTRQEWFQQCLKAIAEKAAERKHLGYSKLQSLAFPFKIGCGLARGDWPTYAKMLEEFAATHKNDIRVVLYKRLGDA